MKFGPSVLVHRGIASQSEYNPKLSNEFRKRIRDK
jgi:hypothetical protein